MDEKIDKKVLNAAKWSTITEILAKLVVPITNLILARILAPESFGVLATVTVVTSFADMLTDAGFQKYLIQHEFSNKDELYKSANVAFITNFSISLLVWIFIIIFRNAISSFLGNDELGAAIAVASIQIPLISLSSIQMALYKRKLDFKTLFYRRIIAVLIPFFVTIPLAIFGFDYWSLIIGTLVGVIFNIIILTIKSDWKPNLFFKINILKEMLSFSIWTLVDSIVIWLGAYIDVFIIGNVFNSYYLGLYNNSLNLVNAITNIITASIIPVLLSGLSRVQNDEKEYNNLLISTQKIMAYLLIPMGVGIFLYQDFIISFLLGSKWNEAAPIIGIVSLIVPFVVLLNNCTSVCYISKGKPKLSIVTQLLYLIPLIPLEFKIAQIGFWEFVYVRQFFRVELILVNLFFLNFILKVPAILLIKNLLKPVVATIIMAIVASLLKLVSTSNIWCIFSIMICIIVYFIFIYILDKNAVNQIKNRLLKKGE